MPELKVVASNGETAYLNVIEIVSIDGEPYSSSQASVPDSDMVQRIERLEKSVVFLIGELPLQPQSLKASSSAESQPVSVLQEAAQHQSSLDESLG